MSKESNAVGALVSLYVERNNAIKNKGDVAGLNAEINEYVEKNNISDSQRRASSVAASNVETKNKGGVMKKKKGPMQMAMGGMANGKKHMYLSKGALVTENLNPGLQALAKERPDVVRKILKK
tara:strand:- start:920 stop:1288 length:369 start_codon:yes stop_codon:yes gene_type:complete